MALNYRPISRPDGVFACVNSGLGFKSYFDTFLKDLQYLYIIKGGPGTGKSTLMKAVSLAARQKGMRVLDIYCSSDPSSLDGVILPEKSVGLVDGTAPHVAEPVLPGAREQIIHPGNYWEKEKLVAHKEEIETLSSLKSRAYNRAFSLFSASQKTRDTINSLASPYILEEKMDASVKKIFKKEERSFTGTPIIYPQKALSMDGAVEITDTVNEATRILTVLPYYRLESLFLNRILSYDHERSYRISPDPITLLPDSIYDPSTGLLVRCGKPLALPQEKLLSPGKFFSLPKEEKRMLKQLEKQADTLVTLGLEQMRAVSESHFALENIYRDAMHFEGVDILKNDLISDIFNGQENG